MFARQETQSMFAHAQPPLEHKTLIPKTPTDDHVSDANIVIYASWINCDSQTFARLPLSWQTFSRSY